MWRATNSERSRILPPRPAKLGEGWGEGKQGFKHGDGVPRARTLTRRSSVGGLSALRALRVRHAPPLPHARFARALADFVGEAVWPLRGRGMG